MFATLLAPLGRHRVVLLAAAGAAVFFLCGYLAPGWFSRMWAILAPAAWTLVVVRLVAARATLPVRAFAICMAMGMLIAVYVAPMATRLPNPYRAAGPWYEEFTAMARLATLVVPVAIVLLKGRVYQVLSVADAFLLAFATGFAFDVTALLLSGDMARNPFPIDYLPPFQLAVRDTVTIPGSAYWAGLVVLTLSAALRFRTPLARLMRLPGERWSFAIPIAATAMVFLWCATEAAALSMPDPEVWRVLRVGRNGSLTAIVALGALIALSWAEFRWAPLAGAAPTAFQSLNDALLRERARRQEAASPARGWRDAAVVQAAGWLALVAALFLLPKSPLLGKFWSMPVLHMPLGVAGLTTFMLALAIILISRFVGSMPESAVRRHPHDVVEFRLEKTVLGLGLALAILVILYAPPAGEPVTLYNPAVALSDSVAQPTGPLLLLFALAATGIAARRSSQWAAAPVAARRQSVVRHGLAVAAALVLIWVPLVVYPATVVRLHIAIGPTLKPLFLRHYGEERSADMLAGLGTSNTIAVLAAVVATAVMIAVAAGVHSWSRRTERFLLGPDDEAGRTA